MATTSSIEASEVWFSHRESQAEGDVCGRKAERDRRREERVSTSGHLSCGERFIVGSYCFVVRQKINPKNNK